MKNVKSSAISDTQLQVLLGYAEEDIYDQSRQATAFGLLKVTSQILACWCSDFFLGGDVQEESEIKCVNNCQSFILSALCFHVYLSPPGNSVEEADCSRDGGGVEEGSQAIRHWQQRYDQNSLPTGTRT